MASPWKIPENLLSATYFSEGCTRPGLGIPSQSSTVVCIVASVRSGVDAGGRIQATLSHVCINRLLSSYRAPTSLGDPNVYNLLGVFDGHNGGEAAVFLQTNLERVRLHLAAEF